VFRVKAERVVIGAARATEVAGAGPRQVRDGRHARLDDDLHHGAALRLIAVGSRAQLVELVHAVGTHRIRSVLDRAFPFDDAPEAFRHYVGGTALGTVVITVAPQHERT
jgi:NADPH:quinone reductase-like Zn-dependent oxidoreductase